MFSAIKGGGNEFCVYGGWWFWGGLVLVSYICVAQR